MLVRSLVVALAVAVVALAQSGPGAAGDPVPPTPMPLPSPRWVALPAVLGVARLPSTATAADEGVARSVGRRDGQLR